MGRTNQCSIQEDEILAEEVRQYPCLYDNSEYKGAIRKKNAWAKIDENRKRPSGSSSHDWEVLLNRYSRKKMKYNSLNVSGAGREKVAQAQANLEEYRLLQWYTLFIRPKKNEN